MSQMTKKGAREKRPKSVRLARLEKRLKAAYNQRDYALPKRIELMEQKKAKLEAP